MPDKDNPRTYTLERLQELRNEADQVGDTASRDILSKKIVDMGGTLPSGDIPADETKLNRLERLRQNALEVGDTDSADKLAELITSEKTGIPVGDVSDIASEATFDANVALQNAINTDKSPEEIVELRKVYKIAVEADLKEEAEMKQKLREEMLNADCYEEPHTPHEGKNLVDGENGGEIPPTEELDPIIVAATDPTSIFPFEAPTEAVTAPESDEERSDGPEATQPVNNGKASVNATKRIESKGYKIAEIPAKDGEKVTVTDLRRYEAMLSGS